MESLHIHRENKPDKLLIAKRNIRAFNRDLVRYWNKSLTYRDSTFHISDWVIHKLSK